MKAGIISINAYTKNLNFACPLHSYAFQQFLFQNGIDNVILDYRPNYDHGFQGRNPYWTYRNNCRKRQEELLNATDERSREAATKRLRHDEMFRDGYKALGDRRKVRYDKFQHFMEQYYVKTETGYDTALLEVEDPGCDCYICATDVIWKHNSPEGFDRGFFLASRAMENKWKIAYAASRGVPQEYSEAEKKEFFYYLEDFDFISVREGSLKKYIEENSDLQVQTVLDPVLLQDASFYEKILVRLQEKHYVLLYYVMEKATGTIEAAAAYAREHHMTIVEITDLPLAEGRLKEYPGLDIVYRYEIGVEEWLGYLRYADYVFTNSFHATCFSILFQREFQTGFRMGDKLSYLLKQFGLSKRKIRRKKEDATLLPEDCGAKRKDPEPIDYAQVNRLLEQKRKTSGQYLLRAIAALNGRERPTRDYDAWKKDLTFRITYHTAALKKAKKEAAEQVDRNQMIQNNASSILRAYPCAKRAGQSGGWVLRVRIVDRWFYCRRDGELTQEEEFTGNYCQPFEQGFREVADRIGKDYLRGRIALKTLRRDRREMVYREYLFAPGEKIPYIPVGQIDAMVAEPVDT